MNGILKIPNRIKDIDIIGIASNAFLGIENLKLVIIDDGIKIIENKSFYACERLTKIKLPNTISKIEDEAFAFCDYLDSIIIPESIQEIGENTFDNLYMETIIIAKEEQLENEPWGADDTSNKFNITYLEFLKLMQEPKWIVKEYELGILDKNAEELEKIWVEICKEKGAEEEIGEFNTFDEYLILIGMTRQEFEEYYKSQGFTTEENFLRFGILFGL